MKSTNSKVNRTLNAIALTQNLPDSQAIDINTVINDEQDGYDFDFIAAVNHFRHLCGNKVSVRRFDLR